MAIENLSLIQNVQRYAAQFHKLSKIVKYKYRSCTADGVNPSKQNQKTLSTQTSPLTLHSCNYKGGLETASSFGVVPYENNTSAQWVSLLRVVSFFLVYLHCPHH